MKKIIKICFILILSLLLTSCSFEDNTNEALEEFNKYPKTNDTAIVIDNSIIYFSDYKLDLNEVIEKDIMFNDPKNNHEYKLNGGLIVNKDKIYFSTTADISGFNAGYELEFKFLFNIYECDLQGNNIIQIFSNGTLKTNPNVTTNNMVFYYEHHSTDATDEASRLIDAYDILNNEHKRIASGKNCTISDYKQRNNSDYIAKLQDKPYMPIVKDNSYYEITNKKTNETKIIDKQFIEESIYGESLIKFKYSTKRVDISEGHIYITLDIKAGNGMNHPYVLFEYDFEKETLEFKQIQFLDVDVLVKIYYLK